MTDFPPEPMPSWRGVRDRIEAALYGEEDPK